jgi:cardiolipin synthase A/B
MKSKTRVVIPHWGREKHIRYKLEHRFAIKNPEFLRCVGNMLGPSILPGNKIKALNNGNQIFSAMIKVIKKAKKTITFETYIYHAGKIGQKFSQELCKRALDGVKIHVILDWVGSNKIDGLYLQEMESAGIEIEKYPP